MSTLNDQESSAPNLNFDLTAIQERGNTNDIERQAREIYESLDRIAKAQQLSRQQFRHDQINALVAEGARPFKVFAEIQGEYSRADNPGCGINGEADHLVVAEYLQTVATSETDKIRSAILAWLSKKNIDLARSRSCVKDFLLIDQLTNKFLFSFRGDNDLEMNMGVYSSLGDISDRTLSHFADGKLMDRLQSIIQEVRSWQVLSQEFVQIAGELSGGLLPDNWLKRLSDNFLVEQESENEWAILKTSLDNPEGWMQDLIQFQATADIAQDKSPVEFSKAMEKFMNGLTAAQFIIETQYFYLGMGLIRSMNTAWASIPSYFNNSH